jgi:hypothetical protein
MTITSTTIQVILFAIFAGLTGILAAILGPTYDNVLVPSLYASALYPAPFAAGTFLSGAASFSTFLLGTLVDPAIGVVGLGVALTYLARSALGRSGARPEPLLARLLLAVLLANFTLPLAAGLLDVAGATYPVIAGWDGGAWQHWVNLAGWGEVSFSWDNGALAFVLTFGLFTLVLLLAAAVAIRNALLAVLLVLLPAFTLLWPIPPLAPLARRGWTLFGELAFLPCVMVIPLELAVGSPNILALLGFLTVSLASPALISLAGAQLTSVGFPSAGSTISNATQRGLTVAAQSTQSFLRPISGHPALAPGIRNAAGAGGRSLGASGLPAAGPLFASELLGHGAARLLRHVPPATPKDDRPGPFRGAPRAMPHLPAGTLGGGIGRG